jgi:hypothetical protein
MDDNDRSQQPEVDPGDSSISRELAAAAELLLDIYLARRAAETRPRVLGDNCD